MVIKTPQSVSDFCSLFRDSLTVWQRKVIPRMIISILMSMGNPNYTMIAGKVLSETRNKSSISRFYTSVRFNPDRFFLEGLKAFISFRAEDYKKTWYLVLDGTATRRGGFTKIGNAIKYRKKTKSHKGGYPSTKAHMFLMGILIAPNGTRFPLPHLPYYTKEYCRKNRIIFKTQVELAAQMILEAPIPPQVKEVMVLADEYYEGERVHEACAAKGYSYIIPTDSRRCLADRQGNRTNVTLHERGRHLSRGLFKKIVLVEGQESTAPYRRLSEPGRRKKRVYRAYTEDRAVAGLGLVRVTYSWKRKTRKGGRSGGETYKVLVSNNLRLSVNRIVEIYELRWQIELFFRELKSSMGFDRFRGNSFTAFARFVTMALLSFMYLEWFRVNRFLKSRSKHRKSMIARARTGGLMLYVQNEVDEDSISCILDFFQKEKTVNDGKEILKKILRAA